ncbi:MAG TPA: lysophospholipid acyltransferase family protein [Saprospiraceae bacterium]|nr:lysophospholipid acyltransferase family protein [Saprospiraceae bacterium]
MIFSAILYYLVLVPVSILPFPVLHIVSRVFYVILFYVAGYRKKVVIANIRNSFPDKTSIECAVIAKQFYKHLCDVLLESQKIFTISKKQLANHIQCKNPKVVNQYYDQGRNVIIAVGHCNSWELMLTAFNTFFKHRAVVIYQPLRNKFFDRRMIQARSRQGTIMLPVREVKDFFNTPASELHATVFAIDQSPSNPEKSYWMKFLNQDTAVLFGTEYYAKAYDLPVIYARLKKLRRGYYELEFVEVSGKPVDTAHGEITEKVTHLLEQDIIAQPEYWLWSHRRWKHKKK